MRSYGTVLGRGRRLTTTEWLPMEDDGTDLVLRLVESVWDDAPGEGLPVLVGVVGMDVAIQVWEGVFVCVRARLCVSVFRVVTIVAASQAQAEN